MYISRKIVPGGFSYSINQSYYEPPYWRSKVILELGPNPADFIKYYSPVAFIITVEEELLKRGVKTDQFELEQLFYPFLNREAQRWISFGHNRKNVMPNQRRENIPWEDIHPFDRRRLIALKLDHREPWRVENRFFPFYRKLWQKSRDEIENLLWDMEDKLNYRERLRYLSAIFALNSAPSTEAQDEYFLHKICELATDSSYFLDLSPEEVSKRYLSRYIWLYFDTMFLRRVPSYYLRLEEALYQEVAFLLNVSLETLYHLTKKDVLRLFREKIKKTHPDKGGNKEEFIRIRRLMEAFLKIKFS